MADALELTDDDFRIAPDAPPGFWSKDGRTQLFTILFVSAAILAFVQLIVPQFLVPMLLPQSTPTVFSLKIETLQANQSVWWQGRLWVAVSTMVPGSPPRTALRAVNEDGTWDRQSDLILTAPFDTAIVDGDRLLLISATSVTTIEDRQVRTTYPKVKLNQPSRPVMVQGTLSILDRAAGSLDVIWYDYLEGEWVERGRLDLPQPFLQAQAALKTSTMAPPHAVRIRFNGGVPMPIMTGTETDGVYAVSLPNGGLWVAVAMYGESPQLWTLTDPPLLPAGTMLINLPDLPADALALNDPQQFPRWIEQATDCPTTCAAVRFAERPAFVGLTYQTNTIGNGGTALELFTEKDGRFVMQHRLAAFPAESPVPLVKPDGTLLFVAMSPIAPMSLNTVELTPEGFGPIKRVGDPSFFDTSRPNFWFIYSLMSIIPLATTLILGIIAHVLVEKYRDRRYSFGNHTVKLASIGRRGAARAIDIMIFGAPMWATFAILWYIGDVMKIIEDRINSNDFVTLITWGFAFALGMMFYVIFAVLFFGTLEGVWGLSPGKWLFNVRVIRTTFQPIGFFRGMIRQFLLIVDGMFNYFVAIVMASCLPKSQRLGDMCADSIVVERSSLPPNWPRHREMPR